MQTEEVRKTVEAGGQAVPAGGGDPESVSEGGRSLSLAQGRQEGVGVLWTAGALVGHCHMSRAFEPHAVAVFVEIEAVVARVRCQGVAFGAAEKAGVKLERIGERQHRPRLDVFWQGLWVARRGVGGAGQIAT